MKKLLALLLLFGIVGCGDILSFFEDKDIVLSCSCMEYKSTDGMCTYKSDVSLIINEEAGILEFNRATYGSLMISPTRYSARDDFNKFTFNKSLLQITHKWGKHTKGGPVTDVYQCAKPSI
tara:strand:+ start:638 stop:1000 length:363 start_codon:yes stop_codon:yes gene_type:complete